MRAAEIVERLGGKLDGDGEVDVTGLTGVEFAGPTDATFAMAEKDLALAEASPAICVLADEKLRSSSKTLIRCEFPMAYAAELSELLHPEPVVEPGVHASAVIDPTTKIDATVHVGPLVTIGARCRIGSRVHILAGAHIGNDCSIGDDCCIHENVTLYRGCKIGSRVCIHAGAVIGADGFGYFPHQGTLCKWPHVGDVVIEDDVEIGANACIDRAKFGTTRVGAGSKIDNLVQVAHNCQLGKMVILAGQTGLAGSVVMEDGAVCAGQVGIADHMHVGAGATLGAQAGVITDIEPGAIVFGTPAVSQRRALGHTAMLEFLIEHRREIRNLLNLEHGAGDE